jgi:hypothetical protein
MVGLAEQDLHLEIDVRVSCLELLEELHILRVAGLGCVGVVEEIECGLLSACAHRDEHQKAECDD